LKFTSLNGESFNWRKLSPLVDFLISNEGSFHPLTKFRKDVGCWFSFVDNPSVLPLKNNYFSKSRFFFPREIDLPERSALSISSGVDDFAIKKVVVEQPGLPIVCSFDHDWSWFCVISVRIEFENGKSGSSRINRSPSRAKKSKKKKKKLK